MRSNFTYSIERVSQQLQKFWQLEEVPTNVPLSPEEQYCEKVYAESTSRSPEGRYIVALPFKKDAPKLGSSRSRALSQFYALEAKLSKDNALATQYREFMEEYINMGHMQEAPQSHVNSPVYYIPHHSVVNPDSQTTRLRVVFNASSKTSTGYSLMMPCPSEQQFNQIFSR